MDTTHSSAYCCVYARITRLSRRFQCPAAQKARQLNGPTQQHTLGGTRTRSGADEGPARQTPLKAREAFPGRWEGVGRIKNISSTNFRTSGRRRRDRPAGRTAHTAPPASRVCVRVATGNGEFTRRAFGQEAGGPVHYRGATTTGRA